MSTTPVTEASPEVFEEREACLAAIFQMLCERMGKLEETTEHWLRRERTKECSLDGILDSRLLGLNRIVELWRDYTTPISPPSSPTNECWRDYAPSTTPPLRSINEAWRTVNIAMPHLTTLANLDQNETRRVKTLEAMARLGLPGKQLDNGDVPLQSADVGLESDFIYLADAVSEEIVRAAVQSEAADLNTVAYSSHGGKPSLFLESSVGYSPESWIHLASRLFDSCGVRGGTLKVSALREEVMRIIVPYHRSRSAAPHKSDPLMAKSKAIFDGLNYQKGSYDMEESLRESMFVDFHKMYASFQVLEFGI